MNIQKERMKIGAASDKNDNREDQLG